MKAIYIGTVVLCASALSFSQNHTLKAAEQFNEQNNLQSIVDFSETLDEASPSVVATSSLQASMQSLSVPSQPEITIEQQRSSQEQLFQQSFNKFIADMYNTRGYADALSQNCSHVAEFLELCNDMNMGPGMAYVGMRLFTIKIKGAEIVDDGALLSLLDMIPRHLEAHFHHDAHHNRAYDPAVMNKQLESIIISKVTSHLPALARKSHEFTNELSQELIKYYSDLTNKIQQEKEQMEATERLRNKTIHFLDTALGKVLWDIKKPETIWPSFNRLARGIVNLANVGLLNHMDDLDDLIWSNVHSFGRFLDIAGAIIPLSVYENIEKDLDSGEVFFLEYQEQDRVIKSKKEIIMEHVMQAKARAMAHERGIISLPM